MSHRFLEPMIQNSLSLWWKESWRTGSPRPPQRPPLLRGSGPWIIHTCQSQMFQEESLLSAAFHVVKIDTFGLRFFPQSLSTLSKFFCKAGWLDISVTVSPSESGAAGGDHMLPTGTLVSSMGLLCGSWGPAPSPGLFPQWVSRSLLALWF